MDNRELRINLKCIGISFFIFAIITGIATVLVEYCVFGWVLWGLTLTSIVCGIEFLIGSFIVPDDTKKKLED